MILKTSTLLKSLEELGALNDETGVFELKPFSDWVGNKIWRNKIFSMRLCNVGEMLDILSFLGNMNDSEKAQAMRVELFIRSIFSINHEPLLSPLDLQKHNEQCNSSLSKEEYLRIWARNLEQIVLERFDFVYAALQMKQARILQNISSCVICGNVFSNSMVEGAKVLKYSLHEIVCKNCIPQVKEFGSELDFEDEVKEKIESKSEVKVEEEFLDSSFVDSSDSEYPYVCVCGEKFNVFEDFVSHRETCQKANE